jgi:hypothetical protein
MNLKGLTQTPTSRKVRASFCDSKYMNPQASTIKLPKTTKHLDAKDSEFPSQYAHQNL